MPTYPDWFEHSRCSLCEHFSKKDITCFYQGESISCNKRNNHAHFKKKLSTIKPKLKAAPKKPEVIPTLACTHPNLVPLEQVAGKNCRKDPLHNSDGIRTPFKDRIEYVTWKDINIINAHYLKVTKYWCPTCNEIIEPPSYTSDI